MSLLGYSLEQDLFDRKNKALDLIAQGRATDPVTLSRLLSISHTWPALRPGAALSFARAGLDATHPAVKAAAQLSLKQSMSESSWDKTFGPMSDKHPKPFDYSKITSVEAFARAEHAGHLDGLSTKQKKALAKQAFSGSLDHSLLSGIDPGYSLGRLAHGDVAGAVAGPSAEVATPSDAAQNQQIGGVNVDAALRAGTREVGAVANMGLQGVQGSIRNIAGGGNPLFSDSGAPVGYQTDVGQQFNNALSGGDTSLGDGFLPSPDSAPARQALQVQRESAPLIGGHAFTLGRYGASQVFEPDTNAFNVLSGIIDAGVAFKADPAYRVISELGDAKQAAKVFDPATNERALATGLYDTTSRPVLDQTTKASYLASPDFESDWTKIVSKAGTDGSQSRMMRAINNANLASPTFPITTVHDQPLIEQLAAAAKSGDIDAARTAIAQATEVTSPLAPAGVTYNLRRGADFRIFANMPTGRIADPFDKNTNWKIFDDIMRAGNVPVAARDKALDKYLTDPSPIAAVTGISDTIEERLIHRYGVDPQTAHEHASFFGNSQNTSRMYDVDQLTGVERIRPGIGIAGDGHPIAGPTLISEGLNSPLPIPDLRALRRQASDFNFITASAPWKVTQTALAAPSMIWKPLQVLTARMAVRIFGESQLNMATRGMTNAFTDPIDTIGLLMGANQDKRIVTMLEKLPGFKGLASYLNGPDGMNLVGETDNLFMHSASFIHDPETIVTKGYHGVPPTHADAGFGLAEQLGRMHADPIMRGVAEQGNPAAAKEWFWSGDGVEARLARAPITANTDEYNMSRLAAGKLTHYDPIGDIVNSREAADRYLDTNYFPRLHDMTGGGHSDLMDAVLTGKLNGRDIYNVSGGKDLSVIDERAAKYAKSLLDQGIGPQRSIPLRQVLDVAGAARASHYARTALDWTFLHLVDLPDRELNRIPAWSQALWKNSEELAPYLEAADLPKFIANAEAANLPAEQMARIRSLALDGTSSRRLTIPQLTKLAKANAADDIRLIVHDLTSRSQFFDMVRALIPFGDAFRLIAARMLKLVREEPQVVRRLQQGIQEAQSPGSSTINKLLGDPVRPGDGFFHDDPTSGEQVFTFPGSTWLTEHTPISPNLSIDPTTWFPSRLLGVKVPLQGSVSGLNMLGEGYPGFGGPMVSIPAKWFLPDNPTGNHIREILFPHGGSESQGVGADIGNTFIPSWLGKIIQGPVDQKTFNNTVHQVMATLYSKGDYHDTPEDMARLAEDAKTDARWIYTIRGVAQFLTPGAPNPNYQSYDKHGHMIATQVLADRFRAHQEKDGPDKALVWLFKNFGTKNIFVTQAGSAPNSYAAPTTKQAQAWVDTHPGVADKYPLTYGLYAPSNPKYAFDQTVYNEQFTKGERRTLTAKEQIAQAENRLGFYAYDRRRAEILKSNHGKNLTTNQQHWLRDYRGYLKGQFPGFDTYLASPYDSRKRRDTAIEEMQTAAKDPAILDTSAGKGLEQYLTFRDRAFASAKHKGLASPFQAKSARGIRAWLRDAADYVTQHHPEFATMWEQIFSHEFTSQGA